MSGSSPGADEDLFGIELGVARHPDVPAVVDDLGTTWSYAELDDLVNRLISGLAAHGVGPGDCVSVLSRNRAEVLLLHQAVFRGGLLLSPLNYRLTQEEIAYIVGDSDSRVLFVEAEFVDTARAALAGMTVRIVVIDGDGPDSLGSLLEADNSPHPYRYGWMLPYTSGTTGRPKGVIRDPAMTPDRFRRILHFPHAVNYRPVGNRHLLAAPLYHSAPWLSTLHTINVAGTVFLRQRFDAERFLADAAELRITSTYLVPTMFHRLLRLPEAVRAAADLSALGSISHTGSNCPPALKHQMIDWVGPVLYEIYAATEASGYYSICDSAQWLRRPGTVGRPAPGVITIRDEQGHPAPAGVVGRVFASTLPGNNPFYYKGDPDKTAAAYHQGDGQYTVGDVGYLDDEGWLFLTGRSSELIISGGVNIYPAEAESVLIEHPVVLDVAVVGVPDEEWGERAVAVVHPAGQVTDIEAFTGDLVAFARTRLASYKVPRQVVLVDDLRRDQNGKLRRDTVRQLLIGRL